MDWKNRLFKPVTCGTLAVFAASAVGCGALTLPFRLVEGIAYLTQKHGVRDAKTQRVENWPGFRVDAALEAELQTAIATDDLASAKEHATRFLDGAHRLSLDATRTELERVSEAGWRELAVRYFDADTQPTDEIKQKIVDIFNGETELQYWFLARRIREAQEVHQVREVLEPIRAGIETPVKDQGRFARAAPLFLFALPSALTVASIHSEEWHGDLDAAFDSAVRYSPEEIRPLPGHAELPLHWGLLQRYAPAVVQEHPNDVAYPRSVDGFGKVWADNDEVVHIDTEQPTVYAYAREVLIRGQRRVQLCYTHWYPEHPKLKDFDPEQGKIEGVTLRITLDADRKPALFETVYNCGCYHRTYPAERLEAAARGQFGQPEPGKKLAIEHGVKGKIDLIAPKTVAVPDDAEHPIIRCRAGWHAIVNVAFGRDGHEQEIRGEKNYTLLPYEELERLVTPDGRVTSMFYDNGLVRGAERLEGVFFTPLGMLSAGQPRQRGTQMIHWDHYGFDDPDLFEKTLRLPDTF